MAVQYSVAFLSFATVFLGNLVRYSLRAGECKLPLVRNFCQKREPRRFYASLGVACVLSLICLVTVSGYVVKLATS